MSELFSLRDVINQIGALLRIDGGEVVRRALAVAGIWLLVWVAMRVLHAAARRIERAVDDGDPSVTTPREKRGQTIAQLLRSVGRVVVIVVGILTTFNLFINIGPLLAGAGILGLAFSFGAQSLVKDVIGGFFMLMEDQFAVGDIIEAAGKGGVVEKMTLRVVVLRDLEGAIHIIPNGEIKTVTNRTRGWARAVVDIGVAYEMDTDRALEVVRDEAARFGEDPAMAALLDGPVEVPGIESMANNSIVIRTLVRTRPGSQWTAGREFRRRIKKRFDSEGIEVPYPQRKVQVRVERMDGDQAAADAAAAGGAGA